MRLKSVSNLQSLDSLLNVVVLAKSKSIIPELYLLLFQAPTYLPGCVMLACRDLFDIVRYVTSILFSEKYYLEI